MLLSHSETEGKIFRLTFSDQSGDMLIKKKVEVEIDWDRFEEPNAYAMGKSGAFPLDWKSELSSIPIHLPDTEVLAMFKECLEHIIKVKKMPIDISFASHPGYPLTIVTYNGRIIKGADTEELIISILKAISEAEIESVLVTEDDEIYEDDEDLLDDVVVEYEEDDELKELMKPIYKERYLSMEGD